MEIRFKLDKNLPIDAETLPRARGYDVETALSEGPAGAADAKILDACGSEGRVFVTLDLDLADIRGYLPAKIAAYGCSGLLNRALVGYWSRCVARSGFSTLKRRRVGSGWLRMTEFVYANEKNGAKPRLDHTLTWNLRDRSRVFLFIAPP